MPTYEYHCNACDHHFVEVQRLAEHDTAHPRCPKCQSPDVELVYSGVFVKTSRKS